LNNPGDRATPSVPPGSVVYAIGDIHGESDKLDLMHSMIRADAGRRDSARKVAVYLGDYVDRGPDIAGVVERLADNPLPGFETVFLKGNHEEFMLHFLETGDTSSGWFHNGGLNTLEEYGVEIRGHKLWRPDARELRDALDEKLPDRHRRFFEALELYHVEGGYLFVHAGIRPGRALEDQTAADMLWIRNRFLDSDADHGLTVVHGHTPRDFPEIRPNRIGIDTGAVYGGKLTTLALEGEKRDFLQV
jgi:serine/threonine protein phosphatase 1